MKKNKLKYIVYLLPVVVLAYLVFQNTKSELVIEYDIKGKTALFSELVPLSRVGDLKKDEYGYYREINSEPVYFDVKLPRGYNKAEIEIEYNDLNNHIFEIGVSRDEARKNFDFITLDNQLLSSLNWSTAKEGPLMLYQKEEVYENIGQFLAYPPHFLETLVYRTGFFPRVKNLKFEGETVIDFPIKESLSFYVYSSNPIIEVRANTEYKINQNFLGTDNLFKIDLVGNKDTVFEEIKVNSSYVAISGTVKIDKVDKPIEMYFAGSRLLARAEESTGIQTLKTRSFVSSKNKEPFNIDETFVRYEKKYKDRILKLLEVPSGNIELNATLFFLNSNKIFFPKYETLYGGVDLSDVDYILVNYKEPMETLGMKKAVAEFNIKNIPTPYNKIRFLLSLPDNTKDSLVKIRSIKVKFTGQKFGILDILRKIF